MRKAAGDLTAGEIIVDRLPGLVEPVHSVSRVDGFVDVGMPPGWQPIRLRAEQMVEIADDGDWSVGPVSTMAEGVLAFG